VSIRRTVPAAAQPAYERGWAGVQAAARALGGRAWRFRSALDGSTFIEFLEFAAAGDPRADAGFAGQLAALDALHPGTAEEWTDATSGNSREGG
jgi:hypothetical protein